MGNCKRVEIECNSEEVFKIPSIMERDKKITPECHVINVDPDNEPCYVTPSTYITITYSTKINVTENGDYVMVDLGNDEFYIYPKDTWSLLLNEYLMPLKRGQRARSTGILLYGPFGVGKTSFASIASRFIGINPVVVKSDQILNKYLGESEKNLSKILSDAVNNQPSIIIFDDGEWILRPRNLANMSEESMGVFVDLTDILLNYMSEIYKNGMRVLIIATTNVSIRSIDQALISREERFGRPIFIPLPDYYALKWYLIKKGLSEQDADKGARLLASNGGNFDNARTYAEDVKKGKQFKFEALEGRGYIRIAPEMPTDVNVDNAVIERLLREIGLTENVFKSSHTRVAVKGSVGFWIPILNELSLKLGHGSILLNDYKHVDEAVMTADASKLVIIVSMSSVGQEGTQYVHLNAKSPVIYIISQLEVDKGLLPSGTPILITQESFLDSVIQKDDLAEIVLALELSYYGVKYNKNSLHDAFNMLKGRDMKTGSLQMSIYKEFLSKLPYMAVIDDISKLNAGIVRMIAR